MKIIYILTIVCLLFSLKMSACDSIVANDRIEDYDEEDYFYSKTGYTNTILDSVGRDYYEVYDEEGNCEIVKKKNCRISPNGGIILPGEKYEYGLNLSLKFSIIGLCILGVVLLLSLIGEILCTWKTRKEG